MFAYFQNFGADYDGTSKVTEGFIEAELPLLKNKPAAQTLDLNVAARHARYDLEGFGSYLRTSTSNKIDANTWKASLNWQPLDWLRFRGTRFPRRSRAELRGPVPRQRRQLHADHESASQAPRSSRLA